MADKDKTVISGNGNRVYADHNCKICGDEEAIVKIHELVTIHTADSSEQVFGPHTADSYFCSQCFAEILIRYERETS